MRQWVISVSESIAYVVLHLRHDSSEKHILKSRNYIPIVETPYVGEFYFLNSLVFTLAKASMEGARRI